MPAPRVFASAAALMFLVAGACQAQAPEQPRYVLKESQTGSAIAREVLTSLLPLNKDYAQLTAEEKAMMRSQYVEMKPEDEPPYPVGGVGKLYDTIRQGASRLNVHGQFSIVVRVGSDGAATGAEVLQAPTAESGRFVASAGVLTQYKPAVCAGQACAMDFPIRTTVIRR